MCGLDTGTDVSAFGGRMLPFVSFGEHQLQLAFSGDLHCSISVQGDYNVSDPDSPPVTYTEAVAAALLRLLGRTVESANVPEGGTVRLVFDDGKSSTCSTPRPSARVIS
jgi:hypothetical protein